MTSSLDSGDSLEPAPERAGESEPPLTNGVQSEVAARPVPRPRSKFISKKEEPSVAESSQNGDSAEVKKRSPPVRPPPPSSVYVTCGKPKAETNGNAELGLKPPAVSTDGKRSPPPQRPPPPSGYYDRYSSLRKQTPTNDAEDTRTEDSTSPTQDTLCEISEETAEESDGAAVLPRQPLQISYSAPSALYESSPSQSLPPPPPFTPPSPPSQTEESTYSEIEFPPYLTVLPEDDKNAQTHSRKTSLAESQRRGAPTRQHTSKESEEIYGMLRWLKKVSKLDCMTLSVYGLSLEEEIRTFDQRADNVKQALRLYNLLMIKRNEVLREQISQFRATADTLDKRRKKTKTLTVAGSTTGAVGGVTAVLGIALAPVTLGVSLVATAVGAGMVAAAGGIGAHAANTAKNVVSRTSIENSVEDYKRKVVDMEHCLEFILSGMNELQRHDLARLQRAGAKLDALRIAHLSQAVFKNNMKLGGRTSSERLLQAFAKELFTYFKEKHPEQLRKSKKTKFSGRVHLLAQNLQDELDYLNQMWENFC